MNTLNNILAHFNSSVYTKLKEQLCLTIILLSLLLVTSLGNYFHPSDYGKINPQSLYVVEGGIGGSGIITTTGTKPTPV